MCACTFSVPLAQGAWEWLPHMAHFTAIQNFISSSFGALDLVPVEEAVVISDTFVLRSLEK